MATLEETEDIFEPENKGRSPVERLVVWGLIVALLAVLGIEFRAQKGYASSREALEKYATDHPDEEMKFSFAKDSMQFGPAMDGPKPSPTNKMADLYEFSWMSIFKSGEYRIFVEVEKNPNKGEEPHVFTFYTPRAAEEKAPPSNANLPSDHESNTTDGGFAGTGQFGNRQFGDGNFGNVQFGNRQENRPSGPGPVAVALDKDGNGELSAAEIDNAAEILLGLDANEDGEITSDEIEKIGGGRPQRPQLE